jgi:hypothetical protein
MKLTDILEERGIDALTLREHLLWACKELRERHLPEDSSDKLKFKKEIILSNTGLLVYEIEQDLDPPLSADDIFSALN